MTNKSNKIKNTHIFMSWFWLYQKDLNLIETLVYPRKFKGLIIQNKELSSCKDGCVFSVHSLKRNHKILFAQNNNKLFLACGVNRKTTFYSKEYIEVDTVYNLHHYINSLIKKYSYKSI